ncbi:MAG: ASCH domain-containing protein [Rhodobacteraceae bacterium]|nr:ASCH domain-containing protein [Paracoccaceae bacterium]
MADANAPAPAPADTQAIAAFWAEAQRARPDLKLGAVYRTACIGTNAQTNAVILDLIIKGEKVGTFPLPRALEKKGQPLPKPGDVTVQLDFDGKPRLLVRTTSLDVKPFKDIGPADTAIDGPKMRDPHAWRGVHIAHYTRLLAAVGLEFAEDMPVGVERFEFIYDGAKAPS